MSDGANAYEVSSRMAGENLTVSVIRHDSAEEMLVDLEKEYVECAKSVHGMDDFPSGISALTVGDEVDGESKILIYIPYGHPEECYAEIVSHEAVHAALAILRHKRNGKMDDFTPLSVAIGGLAGSVEEESVAFWVGQMTSFIWRMMSHIDEHKCSVSE